MVEKGCTAVCRAVEKQRCTAETGVCRAVEELEEMRKLQNGWLRKLPNSRKRQRAVESGLRCHCGKHHDVDVPTMQEIALKALFQERADRRAETNFLRKENAHVKSELEVAEYLHRCQVRLLHINLVTFSEDLETAAAEIKEYRATEISLRKELHELHKTSD